VDSLHTAGNLPLRRTSGRTLKQALTRGYLNRLFPRYVADNPESALQRIEERFGRRASADGRNVDGIVFIRDALFEINHRAASAVVIVASHTHWFFDKPIVIRKTDLDYIANIQDPADTSYYVPVSFVFSPEGPLAYEWVDESVELDDRELAEIFDAIAALNNRVAAFDWPLGIALNYRYKPLFSEKIVATVEYQISDDDEAAAIVPIDRYLAGPDAAATEQVGWHAYSDFAYGLDGAGVRLLRTLRTRLDQDDGRLRDVLIKLGESRIKAPHPAI